MTMVYEAKSAAEVADLALYNMVITLPLWN